VLKVKDVLKILSTMDPELVVVTSSDDEGNSFGFVYFHPSIGFFKEEEGIFYPKKDGCFKSNAQAYKEGYKLVVCLN